MAIHNSRWRWLILALVAVMAAIAAVIGSIKPDADVQLVELHSVDELRTRFNEGAGSPRLVLLLSPT